LCYAAPLLAELSFPDHELDTFKGQGTIVFLETARKDFAVIMVNEVFLESDRKCLS